MLFLAVDEYEQGVMLLLAVYAQLHHPFCTPVPLTAVSTTQLCAGVLVTCLVTCARLVLSL